MKIDPGSKFACWFLGHAWIGVDWPDHAELRPGVFAARGLDIKLEEHWVRWLGSFVRDQIAAGGLVLYVTAPSRAPKVLDEENQQLLNRCNDLLHGLLIQGVPLFESGFSLTGAYVDGEIQIRQHIGGRELFTTYGHDFVPGRVEAEKTARIADRLRTMQDAKGAKWVRLIRATRVLLDANRTDNRFGERFHHFVRVLDAIVKSRQGSGEADFAHRGQTLTVASEETWASLVEIYKIRSAVEHVNPALDAVIVPPGTPPHQIADFRTQKLDRFNRQVEVLARFAVEHILESDSLFGVFATEDGIDAFWKLKDGERVAAWGARTDIRAVA